MPKTKEPQRARGMSVPVMDWWLDLARAAIHASDLTHTQLGERMADAVDRSSPYHPSVLSKFCGEPQHVTTQEFAEALCLVLGVPRLFYVALARSKSHR